MTTTFIRLLSDQGKSEALACAVASCRAGTGHLRTLSWGVRRLPRIQTTVRSNRTLSRSQQRAPGMAESRPSCQRAVRR